MADVERVDAVVIGAGVVGLAVARALARAGREVLILEALDAYGTQTSARNSEVLHAGLYNPAPWLKTRLCVKGRAMVQRYADERGVAWRRIGKLVVATSSAELPALEKLLAQASANGAEGVQRIDVEEALRLEPALSPNLAGALLSPNTGIIDSHGLMRALLGDAQDHGAMLALQSPVHAMHATPAGVRLDVASDPPVTLMTSIVVNAAGHAAPGLARTVKGAVKAAVPEGHVCKGNYFSLSGRAPFSRLIYPMATAAGLGVHLTLDLGGQARFGPDTEWLSPGSKLDLTVDPKRAASFETSVRRFWPGLPDGALQPAFSGLRPKLQGSGMPNADFMIQGEAQHGVPGLVHLMGIESPGLTSCMALAEEVLNQLALPAVKR